MNRKIIIAAIGIACIAAVYKLKLQPRFEGSNLPIVAIVKYGPIPPIDAAIQGIKDELTDSGFAEDRNVKYVISDINFDYSLIPQTVSNLRNGKPNVMVVTATAIAQFAKEKVKDIPLVYHVVTDPVDSGLIKERDKPDGNMTGTSDMQNLDALLTFVKSILPNAKTVGLMYSTFDSNDRTLVNMMKKSASAAGMSVMAIPVEQLRDVQIRIQEFKGKADFIYVGASGLLQSALPVIAKETQKMNVPVFNIEEQAVRDGLVLASFGVDYESIGRNAGKLVEKLLKGADIKTLSPSYPSIKDHKCFINRKQAEKYGIKIPKNAEVVG
ncbi:MAG: ABC transporter substrate-binding protein [Holosporales bacterium]|jgi:putative ABC transport system substrate-binding protein|nr:ABC transporter substrate-binding protein [Holosporales bacterium]